MGLTLKGFTDTTHHTMSIIQFQKLILGAFIPQRAHKTDAGYDLLSPLAYVIQPGSNCLVKTGVAVRLPNPPIEGLGVYGRVAERSGLSLKKMINVGGGVIDNTYTGDLGVILFNNGTEPFKIERGDKIAQLIVEVCMFPKSEEVTDIYGSVSERGHHGFGSTG